MCKKQVKRKLTECDRETVGEWERGEGEGRSESERASTNNQRLNFFIPCANPRPPQPLCSHCLNKARQQTNPNPNPKRKTRSGHLFGIDICICGRVGVARSLCPFRSIPVCVWGTTQWNSIGIFCCCCCCCSVIE